MIFKPEKGEYVEFYNGYISRVPEDSILEVLESQIDVMQKTAATVESSREKFRYEDDKWSIRQVFGHMNDAERVFGFRAFCFSRGETSPLPSFDQEPYITNAPYDDCSLNSLVDEFVWLRNSHLFMFSKLSEKAWLRKGIASDNSVSVRALAYIMAGHVRHHLSVLAERYQVRM